MFTQPKPRGVLTWSPGTKDWRIAAIVNLVREMVTIGSGLAGKRLSGRSLSLFPLTIEGRSMCKRRQAREHSSHQNSLLSVVGLGGSASLALAPLSAGVSVGGRRCRDLRARQTPLDFWGVNSIFCDRHTFFSISACRSYKRIFFATCQNAICDMPQNEKLPDFNFHSRIRERLHSARRAPQVTA